MGHIVSVQSFRGGTGKSNICANVAYLAAKRGRRVAALDTDLRSPGLHIILGTPRERMVLTLTDFLSGKCELEETAYDLSGDLGLEEEGGAFFLLPSTLSVEAITRVVAEGYDVGKLNERLGSLVEALKLDFLVLDSHPGLCRETMLTLALSDTLLIAIRPDQQDFQGTEVLVEVAARLSVPRVFTVVNFMLPGMNTKELKGKVEEAFKYEVVGMLPFAEEMIRLGSDGLFVKGQPSHPLSIELGRLTDRLLESPAGDQERPMTSVSNPSRQPAGRRR